jgi:hypothetical protein
MVRKRGNTKVLDEDVANLLLARVRDEFTASIWLSPAHAFVSRMGCLP